jgi:hypothetical protein
MGDSRISRVSVFHLLFFKGHIVTRVHIFIMIGLARLKTRYGAIFFMTPIDRIRYSILWGI